MCKPTDRDSKRYRKSLNEKYEATKKMSAAIRDAGYTLIEMWECTWDTFASSTDLESRYLYPLEHKYRMTQGEVLESIRNDKMFCAVEVDIIVPNHLLEYFTDMPPIFKNTDVTFEDIGDYMKQYCIENSIGFESRRYLIGSMKGDKILLASPLLKWYMEKGLVITKVHQLVEFRGSSCFGSFVEKVTQDRRNGDRDPRFLAIAETSKLVGK